MIEPVFKKVVIFRVGLIGGSFALALRKANAVHEVVGFGRSAETLKQAQQLGIIDRAGSDFATELHNAEDNDFGELRFGHGVLITKFYPHPSPPPARVSESFTFPLSGGRLGWG